MATPEEKKKEEKIPETPATPIETPEEKKEKVQVEIIHKFEKGLNDEKPVEKPTEKPVEKPAEKPVEKPAEVPPTPTETETPREKELREKLEERESQLGVIALKAFEDDKKAILEKIPDEKKREFVEKWIGDDPDKLEQIKVTARLMFDVDVENPAEKKEEKPPEKKEEGGDEETDGTEPVPPAPTSAQSSEEQKRAKAASKPAGKTDKFLDTKKMIDDIYKTLEDPNASKEAKSLANKKATELLGEAIRGYRESGKIGRISVMSCQSCGATMEGWKCATCGWEVPQNQRRLGSHGL